MHKTASLKTSLSFLILTGCGSQVPDFPEVVQYGVHADVARPGFYGVNNKTGERVYKALDDPSMNGAQCLDLKDYSSSESWVQSVKEIAQKRCK